MQTKIAHTPIPWKQEGSLVVVDSYVKIICDTEASFSYSPKRYVDRNESKSNARLIVHRVNTYEALLEALQSIVQVLDGRQPKDPQGALFIAQNAIALAEGKERYDHVDI